MKMTHVDSTMIDAVGYDAERRWLHLRYISGVTYRHLGVPPDVYRDLMVAQSKGSFVNRRVKPVYAYTIVGLS